MNWYVKVLKQYIDFEGRARRKEYWMFALFNFIIIIALSIIGGMTDPMVMMSLIGVYSIFIIVPSIAVTVRRLHDIGKSGAYYFISFIPFIGGIWMLILTITEGEATNNKWGPNPKTENF